MSDNPLLMHFERNEGRLIHKWIHYFEIYHRHFAPFRDTAPTVLEIGVSHGGSLQMWKRYFGAGARVVGVDINPRCREAEEEGIEVVIGDQGDRGFLQELRDRLRPIHVLIDDGGHTARQQTTTFEELYPAVAIPGIYLVEDLHTSYWRDFGGGVRMAGSFLEYSKSLLDKLNAWHIYRRDTGSTSGPRIEVDEFTRTTYSMTYYDSVLVLERRAIEKPVSKKTGSRLFDVEARPTGS